MDTNYRGPRPEPSIELRDVGYRYSENDPWVLRNVSLVIKPGECVAIVGPSGCGKSTLIKVLVGLLDPQEGTVLIGGVELPRLGKQTYRDLVGSVMQDDQLFAGTIADNISFFDTEASQLEIEKAAVAAEIHKDVLRGPLGYQALIGDMGSALSGGQKQRLLLARALYRKPSIFVLDEATSHLDVALERCSSDHVAKLEATRIFAAHRPETIATAARIISMADGRIVRDFAVNSSAILDTA